MKNPQWLCMLFVLFLSAPANSQHRDTGCMLPTYQVPDLPPLANCQVMWRDFDDLAMPGFVLREFYCETDCCSGDANGHWTQGGCKYQSTGTCCFDHGPATVQEESFCFDCTLDGVMDPLIYIRIEDLDDPNLDPTRLVSRTCEMHIRPWITQDVEVFWCLSAPCGG